MKKILFLFIALLVVNNSSQCADWDDFDNVDRMWDGQKTITNQEFEDVMQKLEENKVKKEEKQKKKKIKKISGGGKSLHSDMDVNNEIPIFEGIKTAREEGLLMNTSVDLIIDNKVLERGFYKVIAERDNDTNRVYINFYQSQFLKAKLEVTETDNDFGQDKLDFAELIPHDETFMKLIFGSLDFNAFTYVQFIE